MTHLAVIFVKSLIGVKSARFHNFIWCIYSYLCFEYGSARIYLFKVNNGNTNNVLNLSEVNIKDTTMTSDVVLVSL